MDDFRLLDRGVGTCAQLLRHLNILSSSRQLVVVRVLVVEESHDLGADGTGSEHAEGDGETHGVLGTRVLRPEE